MNKSRNKYFYIYFTTLRNCEAVKITDLFVVKVLMSYFLQHMVLMICF